MSIKWFKCGTMELYPLDIYSMQNTRKFMVIQALAIFFFTLNSHASCESFIKNASDKPWRVSFVPQVSSNAPVFANEVYIQELSHNTSCIAPAVCTVSPRSTVKLIYKDKRENSRQRFVSVGMVSISDEQGRTGRYYYTQTIIIYGAFLYLDCPFTGMWKKQKALIANSELSPGSYTILQNYW